MLWEYYTVYEFEKEGKDVEEELRELSWDGVVFADGMDILVFRPGDETGLYISDSLELEIWDNEVKIDVYYKGKEVPSYLYVVSGSPSEYEEEEEADEMWPHYVGQLLLFAVGMHAVPKAKGEVNRIFGIANADEEWLFVCIEAREQSIMLYSDIDFMMGVGFLDNMVCKPAKLIERNDTIIALCDDETYVFDKKSHKVARTSLLEAKDFAG